MTPTPSRGALLTSLEHDIAVAVEAGMNPEVAVRTVVGASDFVEPADETEVVERLIERWERG